MGLDTLANSDTEPDPELPTELLCVFVHGFKGTDSTFGTFPERLQHILTGAGAGNAMKVECVVFPAYETKGELSAATERFVDWLTTTVVHKEVGGGTGGGAGKTKVVLCGHSMGGLLIADAALAIANSRPEKSAPLWPRIIACIAFDTPYYGLHPFVFKNSASKAVSYAQTAHELASGLGLLSAFGASGAKTSSEPAAKPGKTKGKADELALVPAPPPTTQPASPGGKSGWAKWAPAALGAVVAGAAAGAAYYKKDDLTSSIGWAGDHMKYVGNLWDEKALRLRVDSLIAVRKESGVVFHNFYTFLPVSDLHSESKTFINVPRKSSEAFQYHSANRNSLATDEVEAHVGMFGASTNDGFYELGLRTAELVQRALEEAKQVEERDAEASMKNIDLDVPTQDEL